MAIAPMLDVMFRNNLDTPVTGIVCAVVHSSSGEIMGYTTFTISPRRIRFGPGLPEPGLPTVRYLHSWC